MDWSSLLVAVLVTVLLYGLMQIVLFSKDRLRLTYLYTSQNEILTRNIPKEYSLPFWCRSTMFQILYIMGERRMKQIDKSFEPYNETDEVPCAISENTNVLDWRIHRDAHTGHILEKPVVIVFPGLTGTSNESYLRSFIHDHGQQYHFCVVNRIGNGRSKLVDPKFMFMSNWDTLDRIVEFVYDKMNGSSTPVEEAPCPVWAMGFSLGGHNLLKYLTMKEMKSRHKVKAAFTASQVFDIASNSYRSHRAHPFYTKILVDSLKRFVRKNEKLYLEFEQSEEGKQKQFSLQKVYDSQSIPEFDANLVQVIHGMDDLYEDFYGVNAITVADLMNVEIPVFILHADDDPVCTKEGVPYEAALENDNIIIGSTSYGAHTSFIQGGFLFPSLNTFCDDVCSQFFKAVQYLEKHYRYEIDEWD